MDKTEHGWYRISPLKNSGAEVFIYKEIGCDGVTATDFVQALEKVKGHIDLRLNSPGGEVFEGIAIYNALKKRGDVTVYVDSLAASISSVIAMAGTKVIMARHSALMIHDAHGGLGGTADDMTKMAALLNRTSDEIASVYAERSPDTTAEEWRALMKEETWYNAEEAIAAGLADEIAKSPTSKIKALAGEMPRIFNLTEYKNVPDWVQGVKDEGRVLSKSNLTEVHSLLASARKVHDAACDNEDCDARPKARTNVTIKNEYGMTTVGACAVACLHDSITDMCEEWLEQGTITMDEFLSLSALATALSTSAAAGLREAGVADRECYSMKGAEYKHTVTETYGKDDKKIVAHVEDPAVVEDPEEPAADPAEGDPVVTDPEEPVVTDQADPEQHVEDPAEPGPTILKAEDYQKIFAKALEDADADSDDEGVNE